MYGSFIESLDGNPCIFISMKKKNKSWYKPKGYLHFSPKLTENHKEFVLYYIQENLEQHNFFPLIHETLSARRFKAYLNEEKVVYRSHFDAIKKKPSTKPREIFYANHLDAHIYSYFSTEVLGKKYELELLKDPVLSDSIIAYRKIPIDKAIPNNKYRCNIHFAKEVFSEIENRKSCIVACYDIEKFFPSLNHEYLETCWKKLISEPVLPKSHLKIFKSLIKYSFVEMNDIIKACTNKELKISHKNDFLNSDFNTYFISAKEFREKIAKKNLIRIHKPTKGSKELKGIPQGTPISAFLANLYLLEFDKFIIDNLVKKSNCFYRRYSDDIAIIFPTLEDFTTWDEKVRNKISDSPLSLKINPQKTVVSQFLYQDNKITCITKTELCSDFSNRHSLKYLGFEFDGQKILLKPSGISKFYREMKMAIRRKSNRAYTADKYNRKHPKKNKKDTKMYLTKLYSRFTHLGKNKSKSNYLTYIDRAAEEIYPDLKGKENPIKKQMRRVWSIFNKSIDKYKSS
jgi:hypothetical protein